MERNGPENQVRGRRAAAGLEKNTVERDRSGIGAVSGGY